VINRSRAIFLGQGLHGYLIFKKKQFSPFERHFPYLLLRNWVIPENIHTTPTEEIGS
jgi:hypothetical protein